VFVIVYKEASKFGEINVGKVRFTTFLYIIYLTFTFHSLNALQAGMLFHLHTLVPDVFHALVNTHEAGKFQILWR
jgi:hypothetical protein